MTFLPFKRLAEKNYIVLSTEGFFLSTSLQLGEIQDGKIHLVEP
jgi:hypothetical protein